MSVAPAGEAYDLVKKYGHKKTHIRYDRLIIQSFMAGLWVAVYGHCCTVFSSYFYDDLPRSTALTKLAYGGLFPGAFIAVAYTGTELFTGNTMAMTIHVLDAKKDKRITALFQLLRVWLFSSSWNMIGAVFGAYVLTYQSGVFNYPGQQQEWLVHMAEVKVNRAFNSNFALGIGCNMLVCLATWCTICTADGAGKVLAIWFTVGVFAMGGFEHIVANFYTISAALFCGKPNFSLWGGIMKNFVPVCLGNLCGGVLFTGAIWWYCFTHKEMLESLKPRDSKDATAYGDDMNYRVQERKSLLKMMHGQYIDEQKNSSSSPV